MSETRPIRNPETRENMRAAPACCAATTSTPTASSPPASCAVVTFDGLGEHAFADDREAGEGRPPPRRRALLRARRSSSCGDNFGCGSSREHAPQSLRRFGYEAFIGGSFAEIFAGNCTALGLPCVTLGEEDLAKLMDAVELDPTQTVTIDLRERTVESRAGKMTAGVPDGVRQQMLEGSWDATRVLLEAGDAIEKTAAALPYVELP